MQIRFVLAFLYLSFATMMAARIVYSLYALHLGAGPFEVGVLTAVFHAPSLFFSYSAGLLADRFSTRLILALSLACGAAGIATAWLMPGLPAFYVASVLCGTWSAFSVVVIQKTIGSLSTPETLMRNFSNQGVFASLSGVSGPLLAGYAIDHVGYANALLVLLPLGLVLAVMLVAGRRLLPNAPQKRDAAQAGTAWNDPELRRLLMVSSGMQLAAELYPFYLPLYGHAIGISAATIGLAISAGYVAALGARAALPRLVGRYREEQLLAAALGISAIAFGLLPLFQNPGALIAISLLQGVGQSIAAPLVLMLLYRGVPKERAGAALGLRLTANSAVRVAGPPAFGALAGLFGLFGVILFTAALAGVSCWALLRAASTRGASDQTPR